LGVKLTPLHLVACTGDLSEPKIYKEIAIVNRDFVRRLRDASTEDANINALVGLDCFATMVPLIADDMLKEIRQYFPVLTPS